MSYRRSFEDITLKEILLGVIVILISMTISMFVNQPITQKGNDRLVAYSQSLKIDQDKNLLQYSMDTNVGNVLAYGSFVSLDAQSIPELKDDYSIILREKERYTMHTRTIQDCDSDGNCTTKMETYYTWDNVGDADWRSDSYEFLESQFDAGTFNLKTVVTLYELEEYVSDEFSGKVRRKFIYPNRFGDFVGNIRYYYKTLPTTFNATCFFRFMNDEVQTPFGEDSVQVYYEENIGTVLDTQEKMIAIINWVYYIVWFLLTVIIYFLVAYKWLEVY